jgi:hypothetical protein
MSRRSRLTIGIATIWLAALGVLAVSAQDKYAVKVPDGLPFSDFRGYEDWQVVAVSQSDDLLKAMVANPTMIAAYKSGVPGNGKLFPDGSKIVKIEWKPKKSTEAPFSVRIPDVLQDVFLIEKDSKKYPSEHQGMGVRRVRLRPSIRHIYCRQDRHHHVRFRMPHASGE